jgi:hypothetical protein
LIGEDVDAGNAGNATLAGVSGLDTITTLDDAHCFGVDTTDVVLTVRAILYGGGGRRIKEWRGVLGGADGGFRRISSCAINSDGNDGILGITTDDCMDGYTLGSDDDDAAAAAFAGSFLAGVKATSFADGIVGVVVDGFLIAALTTFDDDAGNMRRRCCISFFSHSARQRSSCEQRSASNI